MTSLLTMKLEGDDQPTAEQLKQQRIAQSRAVVENYPIDVEFDCDLDSDSYGTAGMSLMMILIA